MPTVLLGNTLVIETFGEAQGVVHRGDQVPTVPENHVPRPDLGLQITSITPPVELTSTADQVTAVQHAYVGQSSEPPAWVECDDPDLAAALATLYECPIGRPQEA